MKKILISLFCVNLLFAVSCNPIENNEENEPEKEYYSAKQKEALAILHGSFSYTFYGITTKLTFSQPYAKPVEVAMEDGSKTETHGKFTILYYEGSSYERLYRIHQDGKKISIYSTYNSVIVKTEVKDFQYVDANTFKWKATNDMQWDTYKRD